MAEHRELSYRISATAREGDTPQVATSDGRLQLSLSTPKELGGAAGPHVDVEGLLAAAYAGCLLQALRHEGLKRVLDLRGTEVACTVHLSSGDQGFSLEIVLEASLPALSVEQAQELIAAACATWPYAEGRAPHSPTVRLKQHSGSLASSDPEYSTERRGYGG